MRGFVGLSLVTILLNVFPLVRRGSAAESRRPNVVVIVTATPSTQQFACYGGKVFTPNIDKIARYGAKFNRC